MLTSQSSVFPVRSRVLIVGGAGYIGSILTRRLLGQGHQVRVLDAMMYGGGSLAGLDKHPWFDLIVGDTRDPDAVGLALDGVQAVVHLGELVGDPACAVEPRTTLEINVNATNRLIRAAADAGVRRFIYPSSCSVYGATNEVATEGSAPNPVSLYGEAKVLAEQSVADFAAAGLETVTLRLATVYGHSPRPRFDLVVNHFAARAAVERKIAVHGGGQWRPFVHVADVAELMVECLEAPASMVAGRTFNVGSDVQNHTIGEVAEMVRQLTPAASVQIEPIDDHRNYRVSFDLLTRTLGFRPTRSLMDGIAEVQGAVTEGVIRDFRAPLFSNVQMVRRGVASMANGTARQAPAMLPGGLAAIASEGRVAS